MTKHLASVLALLMISLTVWCQVTITGTVIGEGYNFPLPGANVVEKGTQNSTITNTDGTFTITATSPNSILVFLFVGMVSKEYPLKGQRQVFVKMKLDCRKDFFDSQDILIHANSGLINTPLGGQLEITSPPFSDGAIKGSFGYQTNLDNNEFQNRQIELSHFISNCDFDMDFRGHNRHVSFDNELNFKAHSFETDLNISNIKLIAGYSHLSFNKIATIDNENLAGSLIGFGTFFGQPFYPIVIAKVSFYNDKLEYKASIRGGYRQLLCFVKFYKLNSFDESSLGVGTIAGYRLKRKKK